MKVFLKVLSAAVVVAIPMSHVNAQPTSAGITQPAAYSSGVERGLTRAEVKADLAMWKRAGMDDFWNRNETPDFYSRDYRLAYAEYVRLRSGMEYQQELDRLQR